MVKELNVIEKIKNTAALIIPENGSVLLYGSRARGEAHEDLDWDILILLEKDHISKEDYDNVVYPFYKLGWEMNAMISPIIYTKKEWKSNSFTPFYKNVEQDKVSLYGA